jgi:hypothetical protein
LYFAGQNNKAQFAKPGAAQKAAALLGLPVEELLRQVFSSVPDPEDTNLTEAPRVNVPDPEDTNLTEAPHVNVPDPEDTNLTEEVSCSPSGIIFPELGEKC